MNICGKNRQLLVAANRYGQPILTTVQQTNFTLMFYGMTMEQHQILFLGLAH
jgi:hypothetical protein